MCLPPELEASKLEMFEAGLLPLVSNNGVGDHLLDTPSGTLFLWG